MATKDQQFNSIFSDVANINSGANSPLNAPNRFEAGRDAVLGLFNLGGNRNTGSKVDNTQTKVTEGNQKAPGYASMFAGTGYLDGFMNEPIGNRKGESNASNQVTEQLSGDTPSPVPKTPSTSRADTLSDIERQLNAAKEQALEIQKLANQLSEKQKTSASDIVGSSDSVVEEEAQITDIVNRYTRSITAPDDGTDAARAASEEYKRALDEQIKMLEQRRKESVEQINQQFDIAKVGLEGEQKNERGATTVALANMGGFLGSSASAQGAILNLAQNHRQELISLEAKRASAIQEANNAIDDKQFDLALMKVQEIKDIEQTVYDRKQDFFNNSLKAIQDARKADEFYGEQIKDQLDTLSTVALSDEELQLDPNVAAEIDAFYGVEGFTAQYLEVVREQAIAEDEKAQLENKKKLLDLISNIPAGQELTFPDGTTYTGMGSANDVYTSMQVDDSGVGRIISYNKLTGETSVTNVGSVGKAGGSGGGSSNPVVKDNVVGTLQIQLEAERLEDGFYDPDTYMRERAMIKEAFPGLVEDVDKLFLDPTQGFFSVDAIERLRQKGVFVKNPQ